MNILLHDTIGQTRIKIAENLLASTIRTRITHYEGILSHLNKMNPDKFPNAHIAIADYEQRIINAEKQLKKLEDGSQGS